MKSKYDKKPNEPILEMGMVLLCFIIPEYLVFLHFLVEITQFSHFCQFFDQISPNFCICLREKFIMWENVPTTV